MRSPVGLHDLVVEGLIEPGGLGDAFAGQIGVMDVWALQHLLRAQGYVDKIEIRGQPGSDLDALLGAIRARTGGVGTIRRVAVRDTPVSAILGVVDFVAIGVALLAAAIATLLAFAAISHVVDSRISDFALMRCAGMDDRGVRWLITADAVLLSGIGVALGVSVGAPLSAALSRAFSRLSEHLSRVPISSSKISISTIAAAIFVGIVIALAASARPANRAGAGSPLDLVHRVQRSRSAFSAGRRVSPVVALGLALLSLFTFVAAPQLRLLAVVVLGLGLVMLLADRAVTLTLIALRLPVNLLPRIFQLSGSALLTARSGRTIPITIVASVVGGAVAVLLVLDSITSSIDLDIEERYRSGAAIYPGDPGSGTLQGNILDATLEIVLGTPGVQDVAIYHNSVVPYGDGTIGLGAISAEVLFERGAFRGDAAALDGLLRGEVTISPTFKRRFRVDVGDSIELETKAGRRAFRICSVRSSFGGRLPSIGFDVATFDKHFVRQGASFLGLWTSLPLEGVLEEISRRTSDVQPLFFRHGAALRSYARSVAGRFRGLLLSLGALCILTSSLGLLSIMSSVVVARRPELVLMSTNGATPLEISTLVVIDACVIVAIGVVTGAALGVSAGMAALDLLAAEFGWVLSPAVELPPLVTLVAGIALSSALACLVPARMASRNLDVGTVSTS